MERREMSFRKQCYEVYQFNWLMSHGYSLEVVFQPMLDHNLRDFSEYAEYLQKQGIKGDIFVSEREFYNNEYQDAEIMRSILPKNMFARYLFNKFPN